MGAKTITIKGNNEKFDHMFGMLINMKPMGNSNSVESVEYRSTRLPLRCKYCALLSFVTTILKQSKFGRNSCISLFLP